MKITMPALSFNLVPPLSPFAATYHVAPGGNDLHTCGQAQDSTTPKQPIQGGIKCAGPGNTVLVSEGTYVESVSIGGSPITLKAKPGGKVTWRSSSTDRRDGAIRISNQSFIRIEGFTFEGSTARSTILVRNTPSRKATTPVQGIEILHNTFVNNGRTDNETHVHPSPLHRPLGLRER